MKSMKDLKDPMNLDRTAKDTIRKLAELSLHALHVLHGRPAVCFFGGEAHAVSDPDPDSDADPDNTLPRSPS